MDAVIAWVDGADPAHAAKLARHAAEAGRAHHVSTVPTRFHENGEVFWALGSLLRFAPFLRRIHLVTDDQTPPDLGRFERAGLCAPGTIRVVDHREVFRGLESALPTFNSTAIEAVLWRIEKLADEFVYLNDDFLLLQPAAPEDFFRNGRPVLHGCWAPAWPMRLKTALRAGLRRATGRPPSNRPSFRMTQFNGAMQAGFKRRFWTYGHHPHPIRRSLLEAFYADHWEALERQVSYRFRERKQFSTISLANHLAIASPEGAVLEGQAGELLIDFSRSAARGQPEKRTKRRLGVGPGRLICESRAASACIQSLDLAPDAEAAEVAAAVAKRLGPGLPL